MTVNHDNCMLTIREMAANTPDFLSLKHDRCDEFLIFVVGTHKKNQPHHNLIVGANYYGKGVTTGDNYFMKKTAKSGAPIVFDLGNRWTKKGAMIPINMVGKIEGEIYGVPLRTITKLDIIEDNGQATNRHRRFVSFQDQPRCPQKNVSCFMWLGDRDFWEDVVENIIALPGVNCMMQGNNKKFYY